MRMFPGMARVRSLRVGTGCQWCRQAVTVRELAGPRCGGPLPGRRGPERKARVVKPIARHALAQLTYLLERTQAVLYAPDTDESPTPDTF